MVDLTQAHKASIELLGTRHTALVEAVRNYVNGSVQPSIDELIAAIEDVTTDIDIKEKMLLGLASRQATKPVPSLILDFKTRHYLQGTRRPEKGYGIHDLLTVDRATSKWVYSASGKLTEVPAHEPAYQHDPVTGEPQGLLVEESRTNLLLRSSALSRSDTWIRFNDPIVTSDYEAFVPGETATRIQSAGDGQGRIEQVVTVPAGATLTFSFFARLHEDAPDDRVRVLNPSGGYDTITLTREMQRYSVTGTMPEGETSYTCRFYRIADGMDIIVAGVQLEEGHTPSSYIPTGSSSVTRSSDRVFIDLNNEFNRASFTVFSHARVNSPDNFRGNLFSLTSRSSSNSITVAQTNTNVARLKTYGHPDVPDTKVSTNLEGYNKVALSVSEGQAYLAGNGKVVPAGFVDGEKMQGISRLLLSNLRVVNDNYQVVYKNMVEVRVYPRALTEQELIDLTS